MDESVERRARLHAAIGEPVRLRIVEALEFSDRSPKELGEEFGFGTNLLSHHLDALEAVDLIERVTSSGDRRRRYVRLNKPVLAQIAPARQIARATVLFVCSHNSARSQIAAALWHARTGGIATSAGTRPARRVHRGAIAAARRAGFDLTGAEPRPLGDEVDEFDLVVTVCDQAHEELDPGPSWWHWSTPDPVEVGTPAAFDAAVAALDQRIPTITQGVPT